MKKEDYKLLNRAQGLVGIFFYDIITRYNIMIKNENGMALVITLLAVAMMTTVVFDFDFYTKLNSKIAANFRDGLKVHYLVEAGIKAGKAALSDKQLKSIIDSAGFIDMPPVTVGEGIVSGSLSDIGGRFNLNSLVKKKSTGEWIVNSANRDFLVYVFEAISRDNNDLQLTEADIDSIVDWLDSDNNQSGDGAESEYYLALDEPYEAKNNLMDTITELRLIKGFAKKYEMLREYFTVYPNVRGVGDTVRTANKININTAAPYVVEGLNIDNQIDGSLSQQDAEKISEAVIIKTRDLESTLGGDIFIATAINRRVRYDSRYFLLNGHVSVGGICKEIHVVYDKYGKNGSFAVTEVMVKGYCS